VHRGTAQAGHYYSFVKRRSGDDKWLRLDDSTVTEVSLPQPMLEQETFGGGMADVDPSLAELGVPMESTTNAYILVYRQVGSAGESAESLPSAATGAGASESKSSDAEEDAAGSHGVDASATMRTISPPSLLR